ncbi:MAG: PspC domain-containing protein [Pseudonocardia sp.]|nr:PspC domain-containing protein [Pseudonocardia sp.]
MTTPDLSSRAAPTRAVLTRRRSGRLVAGVAGGVADHLGIPVLWVRVAFVLLAGAQGSGVLAYALLWMFVRQEGLDVRRAVDRRERQQALGLTVLALGVGLAAATLNNGVIGWIVGPLGVAGVGVAVVWREADEAQRRRWAVGARAGVLGMGGSGGRAMVIRIVAGVLFVASGIAVFLLGQLNLGQLQFGVLAVLATIVGVAVLTVPWWVRLVRELGEERRERIVESERAEIAAHLHDSVLQTLALIQRQAADPREVQRLARGQERELRTWLYGPTGYGRGGTKAPTLDERLSVALGAAAAEVEDTYAITVNPVFVGDVPLDDGLRALVLASREAIVNAAKHAGVEEISVYVEVEAEQDGGEVHVFVRDRGKGFDPDAVPADRHGLADSIHRRMERHHGTVRLRSTPGEGTEVHLAMPVGAAEGQDQDGARQDDARQDDARQDDARQDDARQDDARHDERGDPVPAPTDEHEDAPR